MNAEKPTFRKKVELPSDQDETQVKLKPIPTPNHSAHPAQVRLNAAAILREDARLRKEEQAQKAKLDAALIDMRDASEFERWRSDMCAKDELERLESLQVRKIEMELAREEAIESLELKQKEKQLLAARMKIASEESAQELHLKNTQALADRKRNAIEMYENRSKIPEEQEKLVEQKKRQKIAVQSEMEEAVSRRKEESLIEQARRDELIREIRELESQPVCRFKGYDPTEIVGYGLLEEMSYAQLKERLDERKVILEDSISERREDIIRCKEDKTQELVGKANRIAEIRSQQARLGNHRRLQKREDAEKKKQQQQGLRERGLLSAYDKLSAKKRNKQLEQNRLEKELEEIKLKRQYLNANRALVEEKAYREQELGMEREARDNQAQALVGQERVERIKMTEIQLRAEAAKNLANQQRETMNNYQKQLSHGLEENEVLAREDLREKHEKHTTQKEFEEKHREKMQQKQPYNAKINAMTIANAKSLTKK